MPRYILRIEKNEHFKLRHLQIPLVTTISYGIFHMKLKIKTKKGFPLVDTARSNLLCVKANPWILVLFSESIIRLETIAAEETESLYWIRAETIFS